MLDIWASYSTSCPPRLPRRRRRTAAGPERRLVRSARPKSQSRPSSEYQLKYGGTQFISDHSINWQFRSSKKCVNWYVTNLQPVNKVWLDMSILAKCTWYDLLVCKWPQHTFHVSPSIGRRAVWTGLSPRAWRRRWRRRSCGSCSPTSSSSTPQREAARARTASSHSNRWLHSRWVGAHDHAGNRELRRTHLPWSQNVILVPILIKICSFRQSSTTSRSSAICPATEPSASPQT